MRRFSKRPFTYILTVERIAGETRPDLPACLQPWSLDGHTVYAAILDSERAAWAALLELKDHIDGLGNRSICLYHVTDPHTMVLSRFDYRNAVATMVLEKSRWKSYYFKRANRDKTTSAEHTTQAMRQVLRGRKAPIWIDYRAQCAELNRRMMHRVNQLQRQLDKALSE